MSGSMRCGGPRPSLDEVGGVRLSAETFGKKNLLALAADESFPISRIITRLTAAWNEARRVVDRESKADSGFLLKYGGMAEFARYCYLSPTVDFATRLFEARKGLADATKLAKWIRGVETLSTAQSCGSPLDRGVLSNPAAAHQDVVTDALVSISNRGGAINFADSLSVLRAMQNGSWTLRNRCRVAYVLGLGNLPATEAVAAYVAVPRAARSSDAQLIKGLASSTLSDMAVLIAVRRFAVTFGTDRTAPEIQTIATALRYRPYSEILHLAWQSLLQQRCLTEDRVAKAHVLAELAKVPNLPGSLRGGGSFPGLMVTLPLEPRDIFSRAKISP